MLWRLEPIILSPVRHLRLCLRDSDFHWFRAPGGTDLQTLQRLAGCRQARQLLLPGTFSLSAIAHDLAIARPLAILAGRLGLEAAEATGTGIGRRREGRIIAGCSPVGF